MLLDPQLPRIRPRHRRRRPQCRNSRDTRWRTRNSQTGRMVRYVRVRVRVTRERRAQARMRRVGVCGGVVRVFGGKSGRVREMRCVRVRLCVDMAAAMAVAVGVRMGMGVRM